MFVCAHVCFGFFVVVAEGRVAVFLCSFDLFWSLMMGLWALGDTVFYQKGGI